MPKVSVILTSYNHAAFIGAAIESILAQTFTDFELIIGDDHSTDTSWNIIQSYSDPRIHAFRCEHNTGNVINVALRDDWIHGEYVAIHHSDDLWEPEKLALQTRFLDQNPSIGAVFSRVRIIDETNTPVENPNTEIGTTLHDYQGIFDQENRPRHAWLHHFFYHGNCLCHPSAMLRKNAYDHTGLYDTTYRQLPDFEYWVRLCFAFDIHILPQRLVRYRVFTGNTNTSAHTDANTRRVRCERTRVLLHYRNIAAPLDIFPEATRYIEQPGYVSAYILARLALDSSENTLQAFGLNLINTTLTQHDLLADTRRLHPESLKQINQVLASSNLLDDHQKNLIDHLQLTLVQKNHHIENLEATISSLQSALTQKDTHLHNISNQISSLETALFDQTTEIQSLAHTANLSNNHIQNLENLIQAHATSIQKLSKKLHTSTLGGVLKLTENYLKRGLWAKSPSTSSRPTIPHHFDTPENWQQAFNKATISGWVGPVEGAPIIAIRACHRVKTWPGTVRISRPDVHAAYPHFGPTCGFAIDYAFKKSGHYNVTIEVKTQKGRWHTLAQHTLRTRANNPTYETWLEIQAARPALPAPAQGPLISILVPLYNTPERWLRRAIESVRAQTYSNWELCLVDDASTHPHMAPLLDAQAKQDTRIKIYRRPQNGHISAASNSALEIATGTYCALLDHDDELTPDALAEVARLIQSQPHAKIIYSDEDKIDTEGRRFDPYFKPDWNPDLLRGQNYFCHLSVYHTALLREIGGFRVGYEGAQDWDLALRATECVSSDEIIHIPKILYHWRAIPGSTALSQTQKEYHQSAARQALLDHIDRTGISATLSPVTGGHWRVQYRLPSALPFVSIIIPTRNCMEILKPCIESILRITTYARYEIIIVDNGSDDLATLDYFSELKTNPRIAILRDDGPFNYSALNNRAVEQANGEIIALVNNDIEPITPGWLEEMTSHALRPGVGAVGAMLYYPDNTIQHAGVVLGIAGPQLVNGIAGHAFKKIKREHKGCVNRLRLIQNYSAVTAACLIIRKSIYEQVAGLDEVNLPVSFNDIDFCLRVLRAGYRNVWTPFAELYHHESASRGPENSPEKFARAAREAAYMRTTWGPMLDRDPAYNPNLTLVHEDFSLK